MSASLMRVALALGAIAGISGGIGVTEAQRPTADELVLREKRRQRQREEAAARAAPHLAKAEAKRRRKALKLATSITEPKP